MKRTSAKRHISSQKGSPQNLFCGVKNLRSDAQRNGITPVLRYSVLTETAPFCETPLSSAEIIKFRETVWDYYHKNGRELPWRQAEVDGSFDAYKILVSEIMLQQTQVNRVTPKYLAFLEQFSTIQALANASLADVLIAWSGLGYNRRAKYLHDAAKRLVSKNRPWKLEELTACKGIGDNTAAAVLAYAYNQPLTFIETNVRTVYIHHFFADRMDISDTEILSKVQATIDLESPREFYWALMDYGTHLKATAGNASARSKQHTKQSPFAGSARQIRGQVLRLLIAGPQTIKQLKTEITDERLGQIVSDLEAEDLIKLQDVRYFLAS